MLLILMKIIKGLIYTLKNIDCGDSQRKLDLPTHLDVLRQIYLWNVGRHQGLAGDYNLR
jgi:hypothetical protein